MNTINISARIHKVLGSLIRNMGYISELHATQVDIFHCIFRIIYQITFCHPQKAVVLLGKGELIISNKFPIKL
jgi:hypothetical protein